MMTVRPHCVTYYSKLYAWFLNLVLPDVTPEFEEPDYSVPEDEGPVEVCVRVPAGQLEREAVISLLASGGTATGTTT